MQEFYQSNLLQSLGWAIADSLWQMSLLWIVYQLIVAPVFKYKPPAKHLAAVTALFAGSIWFLISFFQRLDSNETFTTALVSPARNMFSLSKYLITLLPYFSFAYLTVLILLLIRLGLNIASTQKLKVELTPSIEWQHVVNRLTQQMGLSRDVFIYLSTQISVPSTIGFLKPVILLPVASLNHLSAAQMEAVIMHEIAHIRRNDYVVNLMVALVETILFFNPFAHLLTKAIRKECELCCDDDVLTQQHDPRDYAQALLLLETARRKPLLALAATGKQSLLLGRVKRILNIPDHDITYRNKLAALAAVAGLVMLTGLLTPARTSSADQKKGSPVLASAKNGEKTEIQVLPATPFIEPLPSQNRRPAPKQAKKPQVVRAPHHALPVTPPPPPSPPAPPAGDESISQVWVFFPAGSPSSPEAPAPVAAPDPRDRRHPNILRNAERDLAVHPDIIELSKNGITLEKMITKEKKTKAIPGHYERYEGDYHLDLEQVMIDQHFDMDPGVSLQKVKQEAIRGIKVPATPRVETFSKDKEMTIRIIKDGEQIEITVKERK
jgi:beta-lactamase regulating signal transducer with metallopeptidase domain